MKKVLFLCLSALLICSCTSKKNYHKKVNELFKEIVLDYFVAETLSSKTISVWHNAIYEHEDSHGHYCSDFNEALATHHEDNEYAYSKFKTRSDSLSIKLADLKKYPSDCKDEYEDLTDLITVMMSYVRLATEPTGSLNSYREECNGLESEILRKMDAFKIKHADVLKEEEK